MNRHMSNAQRIPVLMYHRVDTPVNAWEGRYCVTPSRFAAHMRRLQRAGWRACSLEEFVAWLDAGHPLPEGSFLLTFDDGFAGVFEHAAPLLKDLGWPAVMFLVADLIGQRDEWSRSENPEGNTYPLLTTEQIRQMQNWNWSFQSHSCRHADLPTLDDRSLDQELQRSRELIQVVTGRTVEYLAYPYGRHDERVMQSALRAGYRAAFSVRSGFNRSDVNRLQIRRIDVFGTDTPHELVRKMRLGSNDGSLRNQLAFYTNRLKSRIQSYGRRS